MEDIKKAIIGVITLAITTAGGLLINKLLKGEEETKVETEVVTPAAPANVIINIPQQEKDTVVKKVYIKPKVKETETEKRKKKIDW